VPERTWPPAAWVGTAWRNGRPGVEARSRLPRARHPVSVDAARTTASAREPYGTAIHEPTQQNHLAPEVIRRPRQHRQLDIPRLAPRRQPPPPPARTSTRREVRPPPAGTGKTHLAIAISIRACLAGQRVQSATATQWVARPPEAPRHGRKPGRSWGEQMAIDTRSTGRRYGISLPWLVRNHAAVATDPGRRGLSRTRPAISKCTLQQAYGPAPRTCANLRTALNS